jgi:homoserine O-acetyltransferase
MENRYRISATLDQAGAGRAAGADANPFLYLVRANQLAAADPSKIRTPALIVYTPTDLVFPPSWVERTADQIAKNGTPVEKITITGPNGHLNGVLHIAQAGSKIAEFLGK